ncbi:FxsB family cyclophane-forming radical SAM/SPASM peptide maturase [Nocardia sp. NPDC052001]|uniref:FxsB family cyclophane-forming radical SAM/SPASM peptide maturase n=1 Tax=Nocardia sp. NPDC052001 TaxID=3154853 RepID=UPI003437C97E
MTEVPDGALSAAISPAQEWPAATHFDIPAMLAQGWRPSPFTEFVVKIASRCNLDCDYCYMYHAADQSWRAQPKLMSLDTVAMLGRRIAEHATSHSLTRVGVSLHGGEPLLAGPGYIDEFATILRSALPEDCEMSLVCQSNATLITAEMAKVLQRNQIRVGISLDGDREANDRHRLYRDGRSSFGAVMRGIDTLRSLDESLFSGVLTTIDLRNDPLATFQQIVALDVEHCDLLLPHANWTTPPPVYGARSATSYADWLIPIFDRWYEQPRQPLQVRIFRDLMNLLLGGVGGFEMVGYGPVTLLSIETNGSIELVDTLKTAYEGATATALSVNGSPLDEALLHPGVVARQIGLDALAAQCLDCRFRDVCGGGMYTHRYRAGSGFKNPSVYCADLYALIAHIETRLHADLSALNGVTR